MSATLDLDDLGYASVTIRPADGSAGVAVTFDLYALWAKRYELSRQFPGTDQPGEYLAALMAHLKSLGFPEMSQYAVNRLGAWVEEQVEGLSKKKSDANTPASPSSTDSPPSTSPPASG